MSNNHIITRNIGDLRGFSTSSIFIRPSNVADIAANIQRAPDGTIQLRRGYQCQIAQIGGMGLGTFNDPIAELLTKIRNAKNARHRYVDISFSKIKVKILELLRHHQ